MKEGGVGGDSTLTGLVFERATDLRDALQKHPSIRVDHDTVYYQGKQRGQLMQKNKLYKNFLTPNRVDWKTVLSTKLLPDDALLVTDRRLLTIVEKKFQQVGGSVDEKLQTCDFKKKQYTKLLTTLGISVQYC